MRTTFRLLRDEPRARVFFAVLAQSSLGTGAAYVALLLIAYERFHSPWAISLVLLADLLPAMFLGPVLGAAADRWSRKACAIVADVLRAGAFLGIALVDGFVATFAFALIAGLGTALFKPAALAALPSLVAPERSAAATSLYGAITDFGFTVGPALAARGPCSSGPRGRDARQRRDLRDLGGGAGRLAWGASVAPAEGEERQIAPARDAPAACGRPGRMPGIRVVIARLGGRDAAWAACSTSPSCCSRPRRSAASDSGFALLVTVFGLGFIVGSLRGAEAGTRRCSSGATCQGAFVLGVGFAARRASRRGLRSRWSRSRSPASATGCCSSTSAC